MTSEAVTSSGNVALETALIFGLRASFFLLAQRYVKRTLFSDLRQVIHEEISVSVPSSSQSHSGPESPDEFPASPSGSLRNQLYNLTGASNSSSSILPTSRTNLGSPSRSRANSGSNSISIKKAAKAGRGVAPSLAGAIFCLSVSECSTLFALILFGGAVSLRCISLVTSRETTLMLWQISLTQLESIARSSSFAYSPPDTIGHVPPSFYPAERSVLAA